jgi:hypothetical protein
VTIRSDHRVEGAPCRRWDLPPATHQLGTFSEQVWALPPERQQHGLSNALIESTNTKIRLLQRMAFGFASADALIALAMLALGGFRPPLPGRAAT